MQIVGANWRRSRNELMLGEKIYSSPMPDLLKMLKKNMLHGCCKNILSAFVRHGEMKYFDKNNFSRTGVRKLERALTVERFCAIIELVNGIRDITTQ